MFRTVWLLRNMSLVENCVSVMTESLNLSVHRLALALSTTMVYVTNKRYNVSDWLNPHSLGPSKPSVDCRI